jgi:hypothetical protein
VNELELILHFDTTNLTNLACVDGLRRLTESTELNKNFSWVEHSFLTAKYAKRRERRLGLSIQSLTTENTEYTESLLGWVIGLMGPIGCIAKDVHSLF